MSVKICGIPVDEFGVVLDEDSGVIVEFFWSPKRGFAACAGVPDGIVEGPYAPTREEAAAALHAMILRLAEMVGEET